jgi:hypothetical protein
MTLFRLCAMDGSRDSLDRARPASGVVRFVRGPRSPRAMSKEDTGVILMSRVPEGAS